MKIKWIEATVGKNKDGYDIEVYVYDIRRPGFTGTLTIPFSDEETAREALKQIQKV